MVAPPDRACATSAAFASMLGFVLAIDDSVSGFWLFAMEAEPTGAAAFWAWEAR